MLLERGYDGLVLRELAESLDIKVGNLQYYFKTRQALALHVLRVEGTLDVVLINEQRTCNSPIDAFRTVTQDMMVRYRSDSGSLLAMITALAQHDQSFRQLYLDLYAEFYPAFEALLRDLTPHLDRDEVAMRARVINALIEGSAFQTQLADTGVFFERVQAEAEAIALA